MTADVALHLQAGDAEVMRRLLARAALEHRSDDTPDIIAERLALYREVTSPIVSWYRGRGILVSVDAMRSAHQVGREILAALEAMRPFLGLVPEQARLPVDLTGLGGAFGASDPTAGTSGCAIRSATRVGLGGMGATGYPPLRDLPSAAGETAGDTPRGLTAGSPRPGQPPLASPGRAR